MPGEMMRARLLGLLGAALPCLAMAQTANVTVNLGGDIDTVDERLFGVNSTLWDPELSSQTTQYWLQEAGIRAIRLPGGSLSDEYHWRTNTNLLNTFTWASGFDKSAKLTSGLNAHAMITVNYGTGTPEEAAAWVAYANFPASGGADVAIGMDNPAPGTTALPTPGPYDWQTARTWATLRASTPAAGAPDDGMNFLRVGRTDPYGFKYWEIGNENYGSWESDLQSPKWDPTTYANRAAVYLTRMKAVDPTIKIGVVVVKSGEFSHWTQTVLQRLNTLGKVPDFVVYHRYDGAPGAETDAALLQAPTTWPADAADLRALVNAAFGATAGAGVEIIVTENNSVYSNPGKQSTSLVNGLYLADSLASVMSSGIKGFFWWDVRNGPPATSNNAASLYGWRTYGDYGILSSVATGGATTAYEKYPTYHAFRLLSYFAKGGDTIVPVSSSNPLLTVYAVRRATGGLGMLVINKDPANAIDATFALSGNVDTAATLYSYGKDNDNAAKPNAPGCSEVTMTTATVGAGGFTRSFPPYSMNVIWMGSGAPLPPTLQPVIVQQPVSIDRFEGATVTFSAQAFGCPSLTYRWQRAPVGNITFSDLSDVDAYSGSGTPTLTVTGIRPGMSHDFFRLMVGNGIGNAYTAEVMLTVGVKPETGGGNEGGGGSLDLLLVGLLAALVIPPMRRVRRLRAPR